MMRHTLLTFMALLMLLAPAACAQPRPVAHSRVSIAEAEQLVQTMFLHQMPDLNPTVEFPLTELTTDEVWLRLGAQVFQVNEGIYQFATYLIKDKEVVPLGTGFGGVGLTSMCVTDLDQNGNPELVYTYSFGSGIHRSQVALYSADLPEPHSLEARIAYRDDDWTLERHDDRTVFVTIARGKPGRDRLRVGQVVLERQGEQVAFDLRLDENLPPDVLERIWR